MKFGIDLGTTYSCISYIDQNNKPVIIKNGLNSTITPSVVCVKDKNNILVGQIAKDNSVLAADSTISFVKNIIGKRSVAISYEGKDYSPEEISAYILKCIASEASKNIKKEVKDVVITIPAYFGNAERQATKLAGAMAGLNVLNIINEPKAAALYYLKERNINNKTVLVYDLGGGTFDVSVLNIKDNNIVEICQDGYRELGGKDWDKEIIDYVVEEYKNKTGFTDNIDVFSLQDLQIKVEKAKKDLSSRTKVKIFVSINGLVENVELTREKFDEITRYLLDITVDKTKEVIKFDNKKGYEKIDDIIMVGGSTRMPQVLNAIRQEFDINPIIFDPDEAVAKGAALYANMDFVNVSAVSTKSYATDVYNLENKQNYLVNLIKKNELIENKYIEGSKIFYTAMDNQKEIHIGVYENDNSDDMFGFNELLEIGYINLPLENNMPAGTPIEVTFKLDIHGILYVEGYDIHSGKKVNGEFNGKVQLSKEDCDKLKELVKHTEINK